MLRLTKDEKYSYLQKLILSYAAFTVVIIGLFGGYMVRQTSVLNDNEASRENAAELEKVRSFIEDSYLNKFQASLLDQAMSTLRANSSEDIGFFLDNPKEYNYYRILQLSNELRALSFALTGLENITLYFNKSNFSVDQYKYYHTLERSPNADILSRVDAVRPHQWFSRTIVSKKDGDEGVEERVLSYIYTLPYKSVGSHIKGYMILDVSVDELIAQASAYLSNFEDLFIISPSGMLLSTEQNANRQAQVKEAIQTAGDTSTTLRFANHNQLLSTLPSSSSDMGWTYASLRSTHNNELLSQSLKNQVWQAILVVLLIGFLLSLFLSIRLHRPVKSIMQRIYQLNGHIQRKNIHDLLMGRFTEEATEFPLSLEGEFIVTVWETPNHDAQRLFEQFGQKNHGMDHIPVYLDSSRFAVIYCIGCGQPDGKSLVMQDIEQFKLKMRNDVYAKVGVGSSVTGSDNIHASYLEALEALEYIFILVEQSVVDYDNIKDRVSYVPDMLELEAFENVIQTADESTIKKYFKEKLDHLRGSSMKLEAIQLILDQMVITITKWMLQHGSRLHHLSPSELLHNYRRGTLAETIEHLEDLCCHTAALYMKQEDSLHVDVAKKIKNFVDQKLQEDLSLDDIAQFTGYSKQFICKVFKEQYGGTINEYMSQRRMEAAKRLLLESELTIAQVAEQTGFRSAAYFCTKFKQWCGVTPAQYRSQGYHEPETVDI